MRIIYFTTSIEEHDFELFSKEWKIALNASNQNFHNKLIRSLAISNKVDVISLRPYSFRKCNIKGLKAENKSDGNITWHYLAIRKTKVLRFSYAKKQIKRLFRNDKCEETVILSDTINPKIIRLANHFARKKKLKIAGICTDSPSNITGTSRAYSLFLLKQSKDLDGYISLTESLNELFNEKEKPNIVIEGVIENELPKSENKYGDYFYFGGALLPRYGVYHLIKAFKLLNRPDIKLLICGHHGDERKIYETIGDAKNILYLKMLPVKEVLALESHAILNINPRPYSEDLDRYSIPSKTLEYFSTGRLTLSVRNTKLQSIFGEDAIWVKSDKKEDLLEGMKAALDMGELEREKIGQQAQKKARELYSLASINKKLIPFLEELLKS